MEIRKKLIEVALRFSTVLAGICSVSSRVIRKRTWSPLGSSSPLNQKAPAKYGGGCGHGHLVSLE